jgi:hypothetical protein
VELVLSNRNDDLLRREADLALRMVRPSRPGWWRASSRMCGSGFTRMTAISTAQGTPQRVPDLAGHVLIGPDRDAAALAASTGTGITRRMLRFRCDRESAQINAIRAGLGIGPMQAGIARASPDLRPVLETVFPSSSNAGWPCMRICARAHACGWWPIIWPSTCRKRWPGERASARRFPGGRVKEADHETGEDQRKRSRKREVQKADHQGQHHQHEHKNDESDFHNPASAVSHPLRRVAAALVMDEVEPVPCCDRCGHHQVPGKIQRRDGKCPAGHGAADRGIPPGHGRIGFPVFCHCLDLLFSRVIRRD